MSAALGPIVRSPQDAVQRLSAVISVGRQVVPLSLELVTVNLTYQHRHERHEAAVYLARLLTALAPRPVEHLARSGRGGVMLIVDAFYWFEHTPPDPAHHHLLSLS